MEAELATEEKENHRFIKAGGGSGASCDDHGGHNPVKPSSRANDHIFITNFERVESGVG